MHGYKGDRKSGLEEMANRGLFLKEGRSRMHGFLRKSRTRNRAVPD